MSHVLIPVRCGSPIYAPHLPASPIYLQKHSEVSCVIGGNIPEGEAVTVTADFSIVTLLRIKVGFFWKMNKRISKIRKL